MAIGMTSKFNILQQSPHDLLPAQFQSPSEPGKEYWVPSRYNIRAVTGDGRLILWNSLRGTMSVFEAPQRARIEGLLSRKGFEAEPRGAVKYLADRGFLIKAGTDEYRRIQLGFGQQHYRTDRLELILLASEDCNFRCEYCYEDFTRGTMQPQVRAGIKKLVEKRLPGLRALSIAWFGGEPLYGMPAIEELAPYFVEVAEKNSLRLGSNMTTNGYLLTPEVAEKLLAWKIRRFQITIDGPPESHDRTRPTREGEGTFETIFENLKALSLRPEPFNVDVRVNFDRNNHPRMGKFLDLLEKELGRDARFKLRFRAVGKWGGPNDSGLAVCGTDSDRIQAELKEEARSRGLNVTDDIREVKGMGAQVCYAARPYNFIIGANGNVMKCTIDLDKKDRNVVGHLDAEGELNLDTDRFALWTEPAFERDPQCQKCVVLPVCQGVFCPQVRFDTGHSPCTPLRMGAKKELRQVVQTAGQEARRVMVGNHGKLPVAPEPPAELA
ncbi:MAG TPA: radical SAM protein [Thermoanaerobaculia bacterium]|jgi:uncharacterized protein|nr:radical SAM protein [Thermoanaerobaculia bacterium]